MNIIYKENTALDMTAIEALYTDVQWGFYTKDLEKLERAIKKSVYLLSAFDENKLVGLLRCVGDEETIMYIQDILVLEAYQHHGIGCELIHQFDKTYPNVRQKVLMTDDTETTVAFYEKCGYVKTQTYGGVSFVKYTN